MYDAAIGRSDLCFVSCAARCLVCVQIGVGYWLQGLSDALWQANRMTRLPGFLA